MASERMRVEVERIIKALRSLGDEDSLDLAIDLDEQVRGNTDAEFARWITENTTGFEVFLEASVSVRVAAHQECRWTELGRDARFALTAVEKVHVFADEEIQRSERQKRRAIVPPAPVSAARPRFTLIPGGLAQSTPVVTDDQRTIGFIPVPAAKVADGTIPAPAPESAPKGAA